MSEGSGPHRNDLIGRFAQHRVAANLMLLILVLGGAYGLQKLNRQFFPNFGIDMITVRVAWPGATAEDVARSITTPLEQELKNVDNLDEMRSTSSQGSSLIVLEYKEGTDMGIALDRATELVGLVRNLPSDAEEPEISKIVRHEDVATLILSGDVNRESLRPLANRMKEQLLDRGIAKVELIGLPEREIAIQVPSRQIAALGQSLPQLGQRIIDQSQDIPAGTVGEEDAAREIRSLEKKRSARAFEELTLLTTADGKRLSLADIASIELRGKEDSTLTFHKGKPAVLLQLQRTENADALTAAQIMNRWMADVRPTLPQGISLEVFDERYEFIEQRINLLLKNGAGGLVLVIAILYLFLNGRIAFWVAAGIPVSVMGTLAILWLSGGSINMISLFALIMALGIIVDDAIVVAEDAMTHYQRGERSLQAAEGGARRMLVPVMSSSLTTIAAFLPLMLVSGLIGQVLSDIPFVVVCVILASLVEAFLILPGHLRASFHKNQHRTPSPFRQKLDDGFVRFRDHTFRPMARWALHNRGTTLVITLSAMVLSVGLVAFGLVQFTFFPTPESSQIVAGVKFASGTPPSEVRAFGRHMEDALWQANDQLSDERDLVKTAILRINQASFDGGANTERGEQYAMVSVELVMPDEREVRNPQFIEAWRSAMRPPAGVEQLSITSPQGGPPGRPIDVLFTGAEAQTLKRAAVELKRALESYAGVTDIVDDLPWGKQQYLFELTPLAQAQGLTIDNVGRQMRAALDGRLLQVFYDQFDEIEVRILLPDRERELQSTLDTLPIVTPAGQVTPLANIIELDSRRGLELLRHTDGRLGVHVTADVNQAVTNANSVLESLRQDVIPEIAARYGVEVRYKGKAEEQAETTQDMKAGALLALALIYIILAWVFAAYTWPLAVMVAIPFGLCGAVLGHWLLGIDLTILSQFGMFGLAGIVINDSIILVTFYKQLRAEGMAVREALLEAACQRLRAVLLTTLTTIGGLLPLLFETSLQAQFLIPMAVSITFGLAVGTLLILLVIPVLLSYIEDLTQWRRGSGPEADDERALPAGPSQP